MFLIWIIPSAVAQNAETMIVVGAHASPARSGCPIDDGTQVRFFDGFAGSSFLSVAGGTVSDVFRRDAIQGPMTIISLSPFVGTSPVSSTVSHGLLTLGRPEPGSAAWRLHQLECQLAMDILRECRRPRQAWYNDLTRRRIVPAHMGCGDAGMYRVLGPRDVS